MPACMLTVLSRSRSAISHCLISSQSVHLSISPDEVVVPAATVHHEHPDTSEVCLTNTHGGEDIYMGRG